jgi:hypothetical protein
MDDRTRRYTVELTGPDLVLGVCSPRAVLGMVGLGMARVMLKGELVQRLPLWGSWGGCW